MIGVMRLGGRALGGAGAPGRLASLLAALLFLGQGGAVAQTTSPPPATSVPNAPAAAAAAPVSTPTPAATTPPATTTTTTAAPSAAATSIPGYNQTPQQAGTTSEAAPLPYGSVNPNAPASLLADQLANTRPPPWGSQLFTTSNVAASLNILDPGYVIQPGDNITLSIYGALPDQTLNVVVDPKGNIEVPGVGPVQVQGLPAAAINAAVKTAAQNVYASGVQVYATPTTTMPITVFVTGPVVNPGPYSGASQDSVIAFLQRAGGIDPMRGSYRNIVVRHENKIVQQIDLYEFLRTGELKPLRLRQGDVIVVGQQGSIVSVYGMARAPFTFELAQPTGKGEEVLFYARPQPETTYAGLLGVRDGKPYNTYLPIADFARSDLQDDDRVSFAADSIAQTLVVQVVGAHLGPSSYVLPRTTTLGSLLARIPLDPLADRQWIHIQRLSAALTQKQLLNESLARLQKAIYTQQSYSAEVAQANLAQAQAIQQYITVAQQIQPAGDVALPAGADLNHVLLEPNDTIVIPFQSQVVSIGGEVSEPQALIYVPGADVMSYVRRAGGFSDIANKGKILIIHPDGTTQIGGRVLPGDRILVLTHLTGKFIELLKDLTQILYQTAIAAEAASNFR
jgi:protein involved in polysaccharide export with SLBB domain